MAIEAISTSRKQSKSSHSQDLRSQHSRLLQLLRGRDILRRGGSINTTVGQYRLGVILHVVDVSIGLYISRRSNGLNGRVPCAKVSLRILEDCACFELVVVSPTRVTGDDGAVIDEVKQAAGMTSKNNLFLSTLDDSSSVDVKGLLKLCSGLS